MRPAILLCCLLILLPPPASAAPKGAAACARIAEVAGAVRLAPAFLARVLWERGEMTAGLAIPATADGQGRPGTAPEGLWRLRLGPAEQGFADQVALWVERGETPEGFAPAGRQAYLEHPAHQQLTTQFFEAFEQALIYDFDLQEGEDRLAALLTQ